MSANGGGPPAGDANRRPVPPRPMPPSIRPRKAPAPAPSDPPRQPAVPARPTNPPQRPAQRVAPADGSPTGPAPRRIWRRVRVALLVVLVLALVASIGFYAWVSSNIQTVTALSGAANTPGDTYLIVGSDSRVGSKFSDSVVGARTDTIMVLHKPISGPIALISIPRDSYVEIPGYKKNKINAAFAYGGPQLLVATVEKLTGLTVDHYVEVGFTGVAEVVDALGGVELCYDTTVDDKNSHLKWTAGCHVADGYTALAFSRMRYSDPLGDIGRTQRQQQLVAAVASKTMRRTTLLNPFTLVPVTKAGLDAFTVDDRTSPVDLARFALTMHASLGGEAVTGTPPIKNMGYRVTGVGSTVLLDPDTIDEFWRKIAAGDYPPGMKVGGVG